MDAACRSVNLRSEGGGVVQVPALTEFFRLFTAFKGLLFSARECVSSTQFF